MSHCQSGRCTYFVCIFRSQLYLYKPPAQSAKCSRVEPIQKTLDRIATASEQMRLQIGSLVAGRMTQCTTVMQSDPRGRYRDSAQLKERVPPRTLAREGKAQPISDNLPRQVRPPLQLRSAPTAAWLMTLATHSCAVTVFPASWWSLKQTQMPIHR